MIQSNCDEFVNIADHGFAESAASIFYNGIHILIDAQAHTKGDVERDL